MKDGPVRTAIKAIARGAFLLNLEGTRAIWRARGDSPYQLTGQCERCAACCEAPTIQVGRFTRSFPLLRRLFLAWQARVNGFRFVSEERGAFTFDCTHFDRTTRRCDSYHSRPGMCRDYPRALLWAPNPEMLPGCGYVPKACGAEKLLSALEREGLDPETVARISGKLKLKGKQSTAGNEATGSPPEPHA